MFWNCLKSCDTSVSKFQMVYKKNVITAVINVKSKLLIWSKEEALEELFSQKRIDKSSNCM